MFFSPETARSNDLFVGTNNVCIRSTTGIPHSYGTDGEKMGAMNISCFLMAEISKIFSETTSPKDFN